MSGLDELVGLLAADGLTLRRAWPRDAGHLLLDVTDDSDAGCAGQWFADEERAGQVAGGTRRAARSAQVRVLAGHVLLQPGGADRRLLPLPGLVASPGAALVAHRPERRAVVRHLDGAGRTVYTKVLRPHQLPAPAPGGVRTPEVVAVSAEQGLVTTAELPGRSLHDLLGDDGVPPDALAAAAAATGAALAALHATPLPAGFGSHDAGAEAQVVERALRWAAAYAVLPPGAEQAQAGALRLLAQAPAPRVVPLHRDLHDKQVVVASDGSVGLLDFDLAAAGEAALDVANLLVHLELRGRQRHAPADRVQAGAHAFLDGYAPDASVRARLPAYAQATRLRLAAVYGFRPRSRAAAAQLLER